jgi:hypothetical protein
MLIWDFIATLMNLCALRLGPLAPAAGPALVLVGTILLGHIAHIEWDDIGIAIPAFLTMVLMPFTYSGKYKSQTADSSERATLPSQQQQPLTGRLLHPHPRAALPCSGVWRYRGAGQLSGHPPALLDRRCAAEALVAPQRRGQLSSVRAAQGQQDWGVQPPQALWPPALPHRELCGIRVGSQRPHPGHAAQHAAHCLYGRRRRCHGCQWQHAWGWPKQRAQRHLLPGGQLARWHRRGGALGGACVPCTDLC